MGRKSTNIKQKLIETAISGIWASSYGAVSVDEICKEAGAQKGSFYYYFESKADLALKALDAHAEEILAFYAEVFGANTSIAEKFARIAALIYEKQKEAFEAYGHVCGCSFVSLGSEVAGAEEAIRHKIEEIMRMKRAQMEAQITQLKHEGVVAGDVDAAEKAEEIQSFIIGCMTMARVNNSLECLKDLQDGMLSILGLQHKTLQPV